MVVFYILTFKSFNREFVSLDAFETPPTVDIFIATYNEPISILKKTVAACKNLDYPEGLLAVYLCDDGKRETVKQLAEDFSIHYLTRPDSSHAKAGNLNHALRKSTGEIVVTLDADMIPKSDFLQRTVGYFSRRKVAFVQVPQAFYNADPFQYNLFSENDIPNEQDFFMRHLEAGKDRFNAVMYVGSNALFLRAALDDIGGFATGVITEDMATGMIIQAKGYRSIFVNEELAVGLSTESWIDLLKQRDRWCRGNIQCAKKWNPLTYPGLNLMQRILYFDGIVYWFFGIFKLIFTLAPILYLVFGIFVLQSSLSAILTFWLPSYLTSMLSFMMASKGKRSLLWSHIYDTAMAPYMAFSVLSELFFKKTFKFHVTRKGVQEQSRIFRWQLAIPQIVLGGLTLLGLIFTLIKFLTHQDINRSAYLINIFWALFNFVGIVAALFICFERPRFRDSERYEVDAKAKVIFNDQEVEGLVHDISDTGARLTLTKTGMSAVKRGDQVQLDIEGLEIPSMTAVWVNQTGSILELGVHFNAMSTVQYASLIKYIFDREEKVRVSKGRLKSHVVFSLFNFLKRTEKEPEHYQRQMVREDVQAQGSLVLEPSAHLESFSEVAVSAELSRKKAKKKKKLSAFPITLVDYHHNGCQIESHIKLEKGQLVFLNTDELFDHVVPARVAWIRKENKKTYKTGLSFVQDIAQHM